MTNETHADKKLADAATAMVPQPAQQAQALDIRDKVKVIENRQFSEFSLDELREWLADHEKTEFYRLGVSFAMSHAHKLRTEIANREAVTTMVPQPVQQQQASAGYRPLFDDAEIQTLEVFATTSPNRITMPANDTRRFAVPAWTGYPEPDIASRIIHDQQFMDLSERYDPTEPTDDAIAHSDNTRRSIILLVAATVTLQVGFILAALVW